MFSWLLGNKSILKVNFEDIQMLKKNTFLINTLEKYNSDNFTRLHQDAP